MSYSTLYGIPLFSLIRVGDSFLEMSSSKPNAVERIQTEFRTLFEPAREIMALFVRCKLILQKRMRSHPVRLGV